MSTRLLAFALSLGPFCLTYGQAQEGYDQSKDCALTFRVVSPDGRLGGMVRADLIDHEGNIVASTLTEKGLGKICDFDFGVYSLKVAPGECIPTVLTNIWFLPGYPLSLTVVANSCGYRPDHVVGCRAYARVVGEDGRAIPGAEVIPGGARWRKVADRYGRVLFGMGRGTTIPVKVSSAGFAPSEITATCKDSEIIEIRVTLKKSEAARP